MEKHTQMKLNETKSMAKCCFVVVAAAAAVVIEKCDSKMNVLNENPYILYYQREDARSIN